MAVPSDIDEPNERHRRRATKIHDDADILVARGVVVVEVGTKSEAVVAVVGDDGDADPDLDLGDAAAAVVGSVVVDSHATSSSSSSSSSSTTIGDELAGGWRWRRAQAFGVDDEIPAVVSPPPSASPTRIPTANPSSDPSSTPSVVPSTYPSAFPSAHPSAVPSSGPSDVPSHAPSDVPSRIPSSSPSDVPSIGPSDMPTREHHPSADPSRSPSANPSRTDAPTTHTASPVASSPVTASPVPPAWHALADPSTIAREGGNATSGGNVALTVLGLVLAFAIAYASYRMSKRRKRQDAVLVELTSSVYPDMMPMVRRSDSGGWTGTYTEEQMQAMIDHGMNDDPSRCVAANDDDDDHPDRVRTAPFSSASTEQQLEHIERGVSPFDIQPAGESSTSNFDTDEDLIKAYEEAMAVDIEPENPDVERAMSGTGPVAMSGVGSSSSDSARGKGDLPPVV
jgi:hypothetical protein